MDPTTASTKAFGIVLEYCQQAGCKFSRQDGRQLIQFGAGSRNGNFSLTLHVLEDRPILLCYSVAGFRVPENKRDGMAEFITRANYGIIIGNLEMDYSDGELRYKTSVDLQDSELTTKMVEMMCATNVTTIDRYLPGMLAIIWGDSSPKKAVADVEGDLRARAAGLSFPERRAIEWPLN